MSDNPKEEVSRPRGHSAMTDEEYRDTWFARVRAYCDVDANGCWIWKGSITKKGYGFTYYRGHGQHNLHRLMYMAVHRVTLAETDHVCHSCDVRRCCNPDHLFLGNAAVNNRDCGNKGRHHNAVKTHCKRGHEFTPENTAYRVTPTTTMRTCLTCYRERMKTPEYRAAAAERQRNRKRKLKMAQVTHV